MVASRLLHVSAACLMLLLVTTGPASSETSVCRVKDCPNYRTIRYCEELGCVRSDGSTECCPRRFNCSSLTSLDKTKCHYDGRTYEPGTEVTDGIKTLCTPSCACYNIEEGPRKGEARFSCAVADCAWYPIPEGKESVCYPTYRVNQCCGTGFNCVNDTKSPRNLTECTYKGKTYLEGQFIEIDQSECMRCVCEVGFGGTLREPWCIRRSCDYSLWWTLSELRGCAPIFSEDDTCCASDLHCPSDEPISVQYNETSTAHKEEHCSFGNHTLPTGGEFLSSERGCIKCTCDTPPFLTCVKLPDGHCPTANK